MWQETKRLTIKIIVIVFKNRLLIIQQNIAAVGHDTKGFKAKDHVYNQIDACCKYRDKKVVDAHEKVEN